MAFRISIEIVERIVLLVDANVIDKELFEGIFDNFCKNSNGRNGMRLRILVELIKNCSTNFDFKPYITDAYKSVFDLFMCIVQVVFTEINHENVKEKLLVYMENDNENENDILCKADEIKKINTLIEIMKRKSSEGKFVESVSFANNSTTLYVTFA